MRRGDGDRLAFSAAPSWAGANPAAAIMITNNERGETMTQAQKMQKEIDDMMKNFKAGQKELTVKCQKTIRRGFTYRKSPAIKASDLRL
jgi:hypothetical protein